MGPSIAKFEEKSANDIGSMVVKLKLNSLICNYDAVVGDVTIVANRLQSILSY